jgi:diphthine-ammonia ligase
LPERGFKTRLSCVKTGWLYESWVGRELNESAIAELRIIREKAGLNLCGEEGEYHTLVTDGPLFKRGIDIRSYSTRVSGSLAYMEIHEAELF